MSGIGISQLNENGFWIGRTSKGEYRRYNFNSFRGNQFTTDTKLFQKLGIVGFFVNTSADAFNLVGNPDYKNKFYLNAGIGITSLFIPEVGTGMLILGGAELYFELNRMFWEGSAGQWIYQGMYEMTDPRNYGAPYYYDDMSGN